MNIIKPNSKKIDTKTDLTSRDILDDAEKLFGRGESYRELTVIKVTNGNGTPCTWYPNFTKKVEIHLNDKVYIDNGNYIYQLSYEICHTLFAHKDIRATVFEEGLCTYFSLIQVRKYYGDIGYDIYLEHTKKPKYAKAFDLVNTILTYDPDFVIEVRKECPILKGLDIKHFNTLTSILSKDEIAYLIKLFKNI